MIGQHCLVKKMSVDTKLWIGGSSGLARTYMNAFGFEEWILLGHEESPREWMPPNAQYYAYNLTVDKPRVALLEKFDNVKQIIISIRPPLFSKLTNAEMEAYCGRLCEGLQDFLTTLLARNQNVQSILHISSVAAANHLQAQHLVGIDNNTVISSSDLQAPYDRFKRKCEEVVASFNGLSITNLRLSAVFSDDPWCIQCQALQIQSHIGSYLTQCIDCNSSRNVAVAIRLIMAAQHQQKKPTYYMYYYTRPARQYPQPVPYGEYLKIYRQALGLRFCVWMPALLVRFFVLFVQGLASLVHLPFLASVNYLLQVSSREHCFDNSAFITDFPEIIHQEETISECFRRRQQVLSL